MNRFAKPAATLLLFASSLAGAQIPPDVTLDPVPGVSGLSGALGLKNAADGSNRLFIVQQNGIVRVIDSDGALLPTPFLSLGNLVTSGGERGLLDIAFHPEFAINGLFYLHYSAGSSRPSGSNFGDTVVAEFSVTGNPNVANNTPDRIILTVRQDFSNHNGGGMNFGPDGYLYLGLGDGGRGNDLCDRAQTLDPVDLVPAGTEPCPNDAAALDDSLVLLGKMLRIDVDNTTPAGSNNLCASSVDDDGSAEYAIPTTNPFFADPNGCGEVFLYGLRNPWRWSFDRLTGDLWIGDVGQGTWEEASLLNWPLAGNDDLGWKICEGSFNRGSTSVACTATGSVLPVIEYRRTNPECSITGGYRYRGPVSSLRGRYIFGDYCSGNIWFGSPQGKNWNSEFFASICPQANPQCFDLRSFGEDEEGNLHVVLGNSIRRFNGDTESLFSDGFES